MPIPPNPAPIIAISWRVGLMADRVAGLHGGCRMGVETIPFTPITPIHTRDSVAKMPEPRRTLRGLCRLRASVFEH